MFYAGFWELLRGRGGRLSALPCLRSGLRLWGRTTEFHDVQFKARRNTIPRSGSGLNLNKVIDRFTSRVESAEFVHSLWRFFTVIRIKAEVLVHPRQTCNSVQFIYLKAVIGFGLNSLWSCIKRKEGRIHKKFILRKIEIQIYCWMFHTVQLPESSNTKVGWMFC